MQNPLDRVKRFTAKLGKPIRPIAEIQKRGTILNVITTTIENGNVIQDTAGMQIWEKPADARSIAIYVDGVFKGIGFFAEETGILPNVEVIIDAEDPKKNKILASYKGIGGQLLDAAIIERGSALKASFADKLVFAGIGLLLGILAGMSYAK